MSKPDVSRHLFLSYMTLAIVGTDTYAKQQGLYRPLTDAKGYIYMDPNNGNLCLRCEHIYVELSPKIKEIWETKPPKGE